MNPEEFVKYIELAGGEVPIDADKLDGDNRTLLYGYLLDGAGTVHVYLDGSQIHRYVYDHKDRCIVHQARRFWVPSDLLRDQKRFYPERCDAQFSHLLAKYDLKPCFTNFNGAVRQATASHDYHGLMCLCGLREGVHYHMGG